MNKEKENINKINIENEKIKEKKDNDDKSKQILIFAVIAAILVSFIIIFISQFILVDNKEKVNTNLILNTEKPS